MLVFFVDVFGCEFFIAYNEPFLEEFGGKLHITILLDKVVACCHIEELF